MEEPRNLSNEPENTDGNSLVNIQEYNVLEKEKNENYLIKLGKNRNKENISIQAIQKDHISNYYYQSYYNLNNFKCVIQ